MITMLFAVILTARPVEYQAIVKRLDIEEEPILVNYLVFRSGTFKGRSGKSWKVYVTEIGMGNNDAIAATELVIEKLSPDFLLFTGTAGSLKENKAKLGDVVVAGRIDSYESKRTGQDTSLGRPMVVKTSELVLNFARYCVQVYLEEKNKNKEENHPFHDVLIEPIVSGEKLLDSEHSDTHKQIRLHHSDAVAVDMEGYGVYRGSSKLQYNNCLVIRGISDLTKNKKSSDAANYKEIAMDNVADFSFYFLDRYAEYGKGMDVSLSSLDEKKRICVIVHCSKNIMQKEGIDEGITQFKREMELTHFRVDFYYIDLHTYQLYSRKEKWASADWEGAVTYQLKIIEEIKEEIKEKEYAQIVYFGSANICITLLLGSEFDRHYNIHPMQYNREAMIQGFWGWKSTNIPKNWKVQISRGYKTEIAKHTTGEIALLLSQSASVSDIDVIPHIKPDTPIINIKVKKPSIHDLESLKQVEVFVQKVRDVLNVCSEFEIKIVHLFPAISSSVALIIGKQLAKTMDPKIRIYEYAKTETPSYLFAIEI